MGCVAHEQPSRQPIVVAMSGGVDSSAAALLLAEQGHPVIGVAMQVWDYREHQGNASRATCCAPADFDDARQVADQGDFPFYVFDFEDSFRREVITPFVESYLSGVTPNPCLNCNRRVKFRELRGRARALGAGLVATGHYARIRRKSDGSLALYTSKDRAKDQSYFLYALTQSELAETLFPVGDMEKSEVREFLRSRGVRTARKAESQDICFVSGSVGEFVERQGHEVPSRAGKIIGTNGEQLGEHDGIHHFTVGQRRGLGVSGSEKLYVVEIDAEDNSVCIGPKSALEREGFFVDEVNWIGTERFAKVNVKMRYRHSGIPAVVELLENNRAYVRFEDQWSTVSPGQAAVFYSRAAENDGAVEVLGGGIISRDRR